MSNYKLVKKEVLKLECSVPLKGMFKLSPFVWKENDLYRMLVRAVNPSDDPTQKVARIFYGESKDGLNFKMDDGPVIAPGIATINKDGVEDPTVVKTPYGYLVYYTGWNLTEQRGELLLSKGETIHSLEYTGEALISHENYRNPKEATVAQLKNKRWALFFEFARDGRSKLGKATSDAAEGPWNIDEEFIKARQNSWDSYHLSTGPMLQDSKNETVMFYNGANADAHWRIGWVTMDDNGHVKQRCQDPLIIPPPNKDGNVDIAFAASAILQDNSMIWLYYSCEDTEPLRALIEILDD
jgi:predicted GH43/DUF377 family glycosyl hydrolase